MYDHRPPADVEPLPVAEAVVLRQHDGLDFEGEVVRSIIDLMGQRGHTVRQLDGPATETVAAMEAGVEVIVGGRLPDDAVGRRRGRPDLLVRAEHDERWRYRPVEIKAHRTTRPSPDATILGCELTDLLSEPSSLDHLASLTGRRRTNGLQLAHYRRMLEGLGRHSVSPLAGVIGKERRVLWLDLDARTIPAVWDRSAAGRQSLLERYDREFEFRLDAIDADKSGNPIVEPVWVHECGDCPWREHCLPVVKERHCVSTLQGVGYQAWRTYRHMGVRTVEELAGVDWRSSMVADEWPVSHPVSLADLTTDPASHLDQAMASSAGRLLRRHGFTDPASFAHFDTRVLEAAGWPTGRIAAHIDEAIARTLAPTSACLRRGLESLEVPSFDIEIDIDMESGLSGLAYLWGTYLPATDQATADADWTVHPGLAAARVFTRFWQRLTDMRHQAEAAEQSIGFYCWHDEAEKSALRSGAREASRLLGFHTAPDDVEAFLDSGVLIDLCAIARTDLVTGGSKGLKAIAPLAGFSWRDDDPDGAASMVWHQHAVDDTLTDAERAQWRQRLIDYNEDDVRAEAAVRSWMRSTNFTPVDQVDLPLNRGDGQR